jgi:hypothetical protein
MEGVLPGQHLHETLDSCGFRDPVVRYNATLRWAKSRQKPHFPQFSSAFVGFLSVFGVFYPVLQGLIGRIGSKI